MDFTPLEDVVKKKPKDCAWNASDRLQRVLVHSMVHSKRMEVKFASFTWNGLVQAQPLEGRWDEIIIGIHLGYL